MSQLGLLKNARDLASSPLGYRGSGSFSSTISADWRYHMDSSRQRRAHRPCVPQRHTSFLEFGSNRRAASRMSGIATSRKIRPSTKEKIHRLSLFSNDLLTHALILTTITKNTSGLFSSGQKCTADRSHGRRNPSKVKVLPSPSARLQPGASATSNRTVLRMRR